MSVTSNIANSFINYFDAGQSVEESVEKINQYYSNPTPENLGRVFGFIGTQALGQIAGYLLDKALPTKGEQFVWDSLKGQFDEPRGYEDERSKLDLKKNAIGFAIGLILDRLLEDAVETMRDWQVANDFWDQVFPQYDKSLEKLTDFLEWWDPLGIMPEVNVDFLSALNFIQRRDPLTLDLDGDGIETVGANFGITFDFDGDGLKTGTGWVKGDDGFLVLDRNGNGTIDSGGELFGVDTVKRNGQKATDGFDALRDLDSNADGVFDAQDAQFANVRVWQDHNQDGIAQAGELTSLAEQHITAINLDSTQANQNSNGNVISGLGTFVRDTGDVGTITGNQSLAANLDLASNPFYRDFTDHITLDASAQALPDMQGSGAVRDLREAAMLDSGLKDQLSAYAQAQTRGQQLALLDGLISEWASSSGYSTFDERIGDMQFGMATVEFSYSWEVPLPILLGSGEGSSTGGNSLGAISGWVDANEPTPEQLEKKALLEKVKILEVFNAQNFFNFATVQTENDRGETSFDIKLMSGTNTSTKKASSNGSSLGLTPMLIFLTEEDLVINAGQKALLNQAYEALRESVYEGLLLQTRLKPYLDTIELVLGENGFSLDYSGITNRFQSVYDSAPLIGLTDLLDLLGTSLAHSLPAEVVDLAEGFASSLSVSEIAGMQAIFPGFFVGSSNGESLSTGSSDSYLFGLDGADSIIGGKGDDLIFGGLGDDVLRGNEGNDWLIGGFGDDSLNGGAGDDILDGGAGNDTLDGGKGNNTYLFGRGDGQDTVVSANDSTAGRLNVLAFKEGVRPEDIVLKRVNDSSTGVYWALEVSIAGTEDKITLKSFYRSDSPNTVYNPVQQFQFADGTVWDIADINSNIHTGTEGNDTLVGTTAADIITGGAGNDTLYGRAGNDTISGGEGNDALYGEDGNDILDGGAGNDTLDGGKGNNTYLFGRGDGQDTVVSTNDSTAGRLNVLAFKEGVRPEDIVLKRVNDSSTGVYWALEVSIAGTEDKIVLKSFYRDNSPNTVYNPVQQFQFADGTVWDIADINSNIHTGTEANDTLVGTTAADIITGGAGNDTLYGRAGNDTISGGEGNDALYGEDGNDVLDGGAGNDTLDGGKGNNTYLFGRGDGQDTVVSTNDSTAGRLNVLAFKEGVGPEDIVLKRVNDSSTGVYWALEVSIAGTEDKIVLKSFYRDNSPNTVYNPVQQFQFADGTVWDIADINSNIHTGTEANDTLVGTTAADIITGGAGNDTLYGRAGNDTISGGEGNDTLDGGAGSDTYLFGLGSGQDVINNYDTSAGSLDVLLLKEGVAAEQLWFRKNGNSLDISVIGTDDRVRVNNWYSGNNYHLDQFKTADGKVLVDSQVQNLVNAMAAFSVPPGAESTLSADQRAQLEVVLAANWQ